MSTYAYKLKARHANLGNKSTNFVGMKPAWQFAIRNALQTKLKVGNTNDAYEREADRVADSVVGTPQAVTTASRPDFMGAQTLMAPIGKILRKGANGQSCDSVTDEEEILQKKHKETASNPSISIHNIEKSLSSSAGHGDKLDADTGSFMEQRFASDFSNVRVHTDSLAVQMNETLQSEAFATGSDLYFNRSRYQPHTHSGKRLLAHELTHVLQQREGSPSGAKQFSTADKLIQGHKLKGFPPNEAALMNAAVPKALAKVKACDYSNWIIKNDTLAAIQGSRYDFKESGPCGWTFPASWYIEIGKKAFNHASCCDLESTIAHEASHIAGYTEGYAREMECECFGCSC